MEYPTLQDIHLEQLTSHPQLSAIIKPGFPLGKAPRVGVLKRVEFAKDVPQTSQKLLAEALWWWLHRLGQQEHHLTAWAVQEELLAFVDTLFLRPSINCPQFGYACPWPIASPCCALPYWHIWHTRAYPVGQCWTVVHQLQASVRGAYAVGTLRIHPGPELHSNGIAQRILDTDTRPTRSPMWTSIRNTTVPSLHSEAVAGGGCPQVESIDLQGTSVWDVEEVGSWGVYRCLYKLVYYILYMFMLCYASSFDWGGCRLGGQIAAAMLMN